MSLNIKINTDNDAFQDGNIEHEVARILRHLIKRIEAEGLDETAIWMLYDINGNRVGVAEVEEEE